MVSMNKKFISTVCICFCALMVIAGSSYYIKEEKDKGQVILKKSAEVATSEAAKEAENKVEQPLDRVSDVEEDASSFTGNVVDVGSNTIEETTEVATTERPTRETIEENPIKGEGGLNGLSAEANATINRLEFSKDSEMLWPVQGNILLEYNMDNTIYFSTLNEYKTNPAIVIQSQEYAPVVAAAKGVVTEVGESDELGVFIKMALGNDYEVTYGQIVNPVVEVGQTVDAGEKIACVNEPTRYYEKEGYNLNFAVTKGGNPVDPMDFLVLSE